MYASIYYQNKDYAFPEESLKGSFYIEQGNII